MEKERKNFFFVASLGLWRLFKNFDLLWIRFKYAPRYRWLRIFMILAVFIVVAVSVLLIVGPWPDKLWPDENLLVRFSEHNGSGPISVRDGSKATWTKSYDVEFAPDEELLVVAELHQVGKPTRPLGRKILTGYTDPQRCTVSFTRAYKDDAKTIIGHSAKVQLGQQVFEIPEFTVAAKRYLNGEVLNWFQDEQLRKLDQPHAKKDETTLTRLFSYRLVDKRAKKRSSDPAPGISSGDNHRVVVNMIPASKLKYLSTEPVCGLQGLDDEIIPPDDKQSGVMTEARKHNLAIRKDNKAKRYEVDGGI
jgi:hypothetical protein